MKGNFELSCCFEDKDGKKLDFKELGENIYSHGTLYKKIFGCELKETNRERRYVKISAKNAKISIYRIFRGVPNGVSATDSKIYIDSDGKTILKRGSEASEEVELTIKPVSAFSYFWRSPNVYNRIAFQIACLSFVVSVISIAATIYSIIH